VAIFFAAIGSAPSPAFAKLGNLPFQVLLNSNGSGSIFMNDGSTPAWKVCKPNLTDCAPFATGNFDTGGAPPGSVFSAGGKLVTPLWQGNLHETAPPSVRGKVRGNAVVTPAAGTWSGGWANDYDALDFSICMTRSGKHCLQVNHEGREKSCGPEGATLIDPAFAGRFLRVVDHRYGSGAIFVGVGHPPYFPTGNIEPSATVSTAIAGRIARPTGIPHARCGPSPLFTASISEDGSAQVTCVIVGCRAALIAQGQKDEVRTVRRLPPAPYGSNSRTTLPLPQPAAEQLDSEPVQVTVELNGMKFARRIIVR
jgi:hypothetical protein